MTLRARFVDSISATPTVRLDLTAAPWRLQKTSRFDPPGIKSAVASTLLMDGSIRPASGYADRTLELHLLLEDATADDMADAIQIFARELDRPAGNIFEYRLPNQTHSVFFRTHRLGMESVDVHTDGTLQTIDAMVDAEPFGYGLREDPVVDAVVSADPAAPSNGCFVDVSGVKGDVETPALIKWPESAVSFFRQSLFAIRRRGTPSQVPFLFQAEAMEQVADTTVQVNDPVFSGAGSNYSRTDFVDNSFNQRIRLTDLGSSSVDLRGTYRVFLRYRKNAASDVINIQAQWGSVDGGTSVENDVFSTPDTTDICMADLGLVSIPFGFDPGTDFRSGTELAVADQFLLRIYAGQESDPLGTLDFDFVLLVPADDRLSFTRWNLPESSADHRWLDAHDNSIHARNVSGQVVSTVFPDGPVGGLPMLSPNQVNRVFVLYEVDPGNAHNIATNTTVSVSYYPRYLSVRPAST